MAKSFRIFALNPVASVYPLSTNCVIISANSGILSFTRCLLIWAILRKWGTLLPIENFWAS
ncbi:unnamed protein product [Meloidogyne enterolobii]|uniref:Uncharacterized protein n=1 Tax=Meloidogyne enterolobii TaxID=390850 RepID=A0ACB0YGR2_MELEN